MKNILILAGVLTAVSGCSKGVSGGEPISQGGNRPGKEIPITNNNGIPHGPDSRIVNSRGIRSNESPRNLTVENMPVRQDPSPPRVPEQPKENPAAAPPKQGEKVASDFKVELGNRTVEVEGVCKLTEEQAVCWKPNGLTNEALATELTNAIKSKTDNYSNTFQFKFMKKNRILVLKSTTKPTKPGASSAYNNYGLMFENYGGSEGREGWQNGNSSFSNSGGNGFDETRTERQVLTGAFNKETKTFPLRYQFTATSNERKVLPFTKGQFTVEGNSYEIVSISDKPEPNSPRGPMYPNGAFPPGAGPHKSTYVKIQVVKINNPNTILYLAPADESGQPYAGLNDKGEPISGAELRKTQEERNRKMMEDQKAGKPYDYYRNGMMMNNFIQSINLDPSNPYGQLSTTGIINAAINIDGSKIKKLSVSISNRTVFVFDKIKLDGN